MNAHKNNGNGATRQTTWRSKFKIGERNFKSLKQRETFNLSELAIKPNLH